MFAKQNTQPLLGFYLLSRWLSSDRRFRRPSRVAASLCPYTARTAASAPPPVQNINRGKYQTCTISIYERAMPVLRNFLRGTPGPTWDSYADDTWNGRGRREPTGERGGRGRRKKGARI
ncbi:hypothetical protein Zmor_009264 [Zophobas morio]|uniref:Uncharacterized protein n=1 Tax=Zophobas morio TaxID=2755281 RepID=A0AA38IG83_9CUCU|nr:hypothetical protein Zmor_009264 [Zophobas morio]